MDLAELRLYVDVVQWCITAVMGVALYAMRSYRGTVDELQQQSAALGSSCRLLDSRLTRVEVAIEHAPSRRDIEQLSRRIETLHGDLGRVAGGLEGIRRAVDLLNEHLLNRERER